VDPDQPTRQYRVVRRIEEPDDVISLVLEPVDGGTLPAIAPGQYVSVFVDLPDGARQTTPVHGVLNRRTNPAADHCAS
jgi:nitric oxide dioxygenase